MDFSAIGKILNIEELSLTPTLKLGGKKTSNVVKQSAKGNITNIFVAIKNEKQPDLIAKRVKELISGKKGRNSVNKNIQLTLSPFFGIIKSPKFSGTRLHLEFAVTNDHDRPKVVKGAYISLKNDLVHFKQFFSIKQDGGRESDLGTRFPIIINSKGAARLSIEFENFAKQLILQGQLVGKLIVLLGNETIAEKDFALDVNEAMVNTLNQLQEISNTNNTSVIFDSMISS